MNDDLEQFLTELERWHLEALRAPNSPSNRKATLRGTLAQEIAAIERKAKERKLEAERMQRKLQRFADKFSD